MATKINAYDGDDKKEWGEVVFECAMAHINISSPSALNEVGVRDCLVDKTASDSADGVGISTSCADCFVASAVEGKKTCGDNGSCSLVWCSECCLACVQAELHSDLQTCAGFDPPPGNKCMSDLTSCSYSLGSREQG